MVGDVTAPGLVVAKGARSARRISYPASVRASTPRLRRAIPGLAPPGFNSLMTLLLSFFIFVFEESGSCLPCLCCLLVPSSILSGVRPAEHVSCARITHYCKNVTAFDWSAYRVPRLFKHARSSFFSNFFFSQPIQDNSFFHQADLVIEGLDSRLTVVAPSLPVVAFECEQEPDPALPRVNSLPTAFLPGL